MEQVGSPFSFKEFIIESWTHHAQGIGLHAQEGADQFVGNFGFLKHTKHNLFVLEFAIELPHLLDATVISGIERVFKSIVPENWWIVLFICCFPFIRAVVLVLGADGADALGQGGVAVTKPHLLSGKPFYTRMRVVFPVIHQKRTRLLSRSWCFHNGIILIVNCFKFVVQK